MNTLTESAEKNVISSALKTYNVWLCCWVALNFTGVPNKVATE